MMMLLHRVPVKCARAAPVHVRESIRVAKSSASVQTPRAFSTTITRKLTTPPSARCVASASIDPFLMRENQRQSPHFQFSFVRAADVLRPQPAHSGHEQRRGYVSRAHPTVTPPIGLHTALRSVLDDAEHRAERRKRKAARNNKTEEEFNKVDETIELALNLNLDPRKPNQALRGSIQLPSGSGKFVNCLVFTNDADAVEAIQQRASTTTSSKIEVGGEELVDRIASGQVNVDQFQRGLGTADMQSLLTKRLARVLGPRGLMPNAKTGTLLESPSALASALDTQMAGTIIQYRTDREGIVHVRVGRASFGRQKLLDNVGAVAREIFRAKPDAYGKGKKSSKNAKYLLRASLTSTQGKGYKIDPRTLDPSSPFFLNWIEGEEEEGELAEEEDGSDAKEAA